MKKTTFYLLTDTHYLSPRNWVEGEPINRRERGDQIALKATPQILDAFVEKILADDEADTVIFTGDNVNNGDRNSHEEFRERLKRLTAAGKKVYVTSATHDYCGAGDDENTFSSCCYTETGTEPIPFLRKHELFNYYYDFGPKQAVSVHRESGSYIVRLCDGVLLAMIDDNGNGRSHCGLFADGTEIDSRVVTEDDNWRWVFSDLPKYREGREIRYTIKEDGVRGYTATVDGYNVTNVYAPPTGDTARPALWIALLALSLAAGIALLITERMYARIR